MHARVIHVPGKQIDTVLVVEGDSDLPGRRTMKPTRAREYNDNDRRSSKQQDRTNWSNQDISLLSSDHHEALCLSRRWTFVLCWGKYSWKCGTFTSSSPRVSGIFVSSHRITSSYHALYFDDWCSRSMFISPTSQRDVVSTTYSIQRSPSMALVVSLRCLKFMSCKGARWLLWL